jgi:hypothetical protein
VPYPHGPTSAGNLGGRCRHHHLLKTAGLWTVTQDPDGVFTVRTATGQRRTVHPADLREALHLMRDTEPEPDTQPDTDTQPHTDTEPDTPEQDPGAA